MYYWIPVCSKLTEIDFCFNCTDHPGGNDTAKCYSCVTGYTLKDELQSKPNAACIGTLQISRSFVRTLINQALSLALWKFSHLKHAVLSVKIDSS